MNLTRREAIIKLALLMGASAVGPRLLAGTFGDEAAAGARGILGAKEIELLDELGETIIPATDIPGAKAVGIGAFIAMMVADCYTAEAQDAFKRGLVELARGYGERFGTSFLRGRPADRTTFLNERYAAQRQAGRDRSADGNFTWVQGEPWTWPVPHYLTMLRELTVLGYFTSEVGCTQAFRYLEVPGRFDGDVPYKKGDPLFI